MGFEGHREGLRIGIPGAIEHGDDVQWTLKRNCSLSPKQSLVCFAMLSALSLSIAAFMWQFGAKLVLPFASLELAAFGTAFLVYARHAADRESILLRGQCLVVEHRCGSRIERVEFSRHGVRVEPRHSDGSLVELSHRGQRVSVGRYVRPEVRRQLARELRMVL